ncbi:MAG: hypothetical protein H7Y89_20800 [Steroidobacteraceae bacterium]|nr:hypothetical protein [Steroidobacteraceae bacterium]
MHNLKLFAAACGVMMMGAALAQIEATSVSTYLLDVDPARYAGPAGTRVAVLLGDEPRQVQLSPQDEICLQLQRAENGQVISARVRVLRPEPHELAVVSVAGPGISPGTYRSTPWGMLLRATPVKPDDVRTATAVGTDSAPVCVL